jgi:large subunit ribosomal protein L25
MPVHLYGGDSESLSLQGDSAELNKLLPRIGMNIPVSVIVDDDNSKQICFVREVQRHPLTENILHVDFLRVDVKSKITASVPIEILGDSPAVRLLGGTVIQNMQGITVEALPLNVPELISIDISSLEDFETAIHISDISVGDDVTIVNPSDALVVRVSPPRVEVEEVSDEAAEGDMDETEAAADGTDPAQENEQEG